MSRVAIGRACGFRIITIEKCIVADYFGYRSRLEALIRHGQKALLDGTEIWKEKIVA